MTVTGVQATQTYMYFKEAAATACSSQTFQLLVGQVVVGDAP